MSDSESESRTAAVGRKRIRTSEQGNYAIAAPTSSAASGSDSETSSKESGEISSSESGQQNIPANSDDDQGSESDDDSSETDSSSGIDDSDEEVPAHSMASPQGSAGQTHNQRKDYQDEELRLSALTDQEEDEQLFYFHRHLYSEKHPPDFIVRCFSCGAKGHMHATCPERKCKHCGAYDAHASHACPQGRKCGRCRQRGHDSPDCTNLTKLPNTPDNACDICGEMGHVEEECMQLWCTGPKIVVDPHSEDGEDSPSQESQEKDSQYDPLEGLEDFANDRPAKKQSVEKAADSGDEGEVKEETPPPARSNWQMALFDDARD